MKNGANVRKDLKTIDTEVSMKNAEFIKQWYLENAELLKSEGLEEINDEHYSFEEAEAIRLNFYEADSMRRTQRVTLNVEVEADYDLSPVYVDQDEINDQDEDYIWDVGGNEYYTHKQHQASILTGNQDRITKRSDVFEMGAGIGLVRYVSDECGNEVVFIAAKEEESKRLSEVNRGKFYASELANRYNARRVVETEMRDFAIAEYKRLAALIVDEDSAMKYGVRTDILVREALEAEFGTKYIYRYCRYTYKGKKFSSFDTFFHMVMQAKHISPVCEVHAAYKKEVTDVKKNAYESLMSKLNKVPASSAKHLAALIYNSAREIGLDKAEVSKALSYAWENGEFLDKSVYFALKKFSSKAA